MNKLVSIVLPTYNGEQYIRESIDSVISQTYKNWELIVVDDCSKDNTSKIVEEYVNKDKRIRLIKNDINQKLPASLNIGFSYANGEYYTWTSDDNKYKPDAIQTMVNTLEKDNSCILVSANLDYIDSFGNITGSLQNTYE